MDIKIWGIFIVFFFVGGAEQFQRDVHIKSEKDMSYYRLPNTTRPLEQRVRLQPFVTGNNTIKGFTEIVFQALQPTFNITLHMVDIITLNETVKVSPTDNPAESLIILSQTYDPDRQFYICQLEKGLSSQMNYTITMNFEGFLNSNLLGFYLSFYNDINGNKDLFAVSQFAANFARYAFPCYDEPAFKARFKIEIVREEALNAISNMPKQTSEPVLDEPGWILDTFDTSVPMSSYLVAFLVSDLVGKNSTQNDHVLFTVWARSAAIEQANYALGIGPSILTYYEDYFAIPFPLPKQDMAAVPDFYYGAMENWGLIIFRETAMLYDPSISSALDLQGVCSVVAHELAHQWYGNLVTMEWWDDVWLNEGFATFMEYLGCDSVQPDFNMADQFIIKDLHKVFDIDALETSHPLSNPITSPEQIGSIYDTIAYSKGGSLIRMMNGFLTQSTFRNGVSNYIGNFSYSNANQDDLWYYLTEQGHKDGTLRNNLTVKVIMDTWTLQMGYPVLNVERFTNGTVVLKQERYLQEKSENSTDTHKYIWWIPITYTTQISPDFTQTMVTEWMSDQEEEKVLTGFPSKDQWVIFNIQQIGYYRVNYDSENWNSLISQFQVDNTVINSLNRAQILNDGYNLAKAGMLSYEVILSINACLDEENEYVPMKAALNQLEYLNYMLLATSGYSGMKAYMTDLLVPLYNQVGFEDNLQDPHQDQLKRSLILSWSCRVKYEPCVQNSVSLYSAWMADPTNMSIISPNLRSNVYCTAIRDGGDLEWDFAYSQYLDMNVGSEKDKMLYGMGCTQVIWLIERYLDMAFSDTSGIRKQDINKVFSSVSENPTGNQVAWDYLRDNSNQITSYGGSNMVSDLTKTVSENFNTELQLSELKAFQELLGSTANLEQSIEKTQNNIKWMTNYYSVIVTWLSDSGYGKRKISRYNIYIYIKFVITFIYKYTSLSLNKFSFNLHFLFFN